jgi:hypothetical protein
MAVTSVATVCLTFMLVRENRQLRKIGSSPRVVAYLRADHQQAIWLTIANVGQGAACNVTYNLDVDSSELALRSASLNSQKSKAPIAVIPQGERFASLLGMATKLLEEPPLPAFSARINYRNMSGKEFQTVASLDVREFEGMTVPHPPPLEGMKEINRHLEELVRAIRDN